jgi:UDP:flavonoid glycosyltransferase YjiC (YdhE family)
MNMNAFSLCFPDNFEQEWNAQRVEELGLGVLVKKRGPWSGS